MSDSIQNMIGAIIDGDKEDFKASFNAEMGDRVTTSLVNKSLELSKDLIASSENEEEPLEETYTFKSPTDAKKFVTSASNAGLTKRNFKIKGKTVDVSGVKDKEMNQMLQMLAKEMKAK